MSITSEIRLRVRKEGDVVLNQLSAKLNDVAQRAVLSTTKFNDLASTLKNNDAQIRTKSINALNDYARAWRELANSVDITSAEFKQATAEALKFESAAAKAQGRRATTGLASAAKTVGSIAAAGVFGGPEGLIGAGIGAVVGGPVGAAVGGAIGAQVGITRQQIAETASYAAEISKLRQALQLVTKDSGEYERALAFINKTSRELAIPQEIVTRQFTQLTASVKGAGGNVRDAEKAFTGIASGIRGTGGSLEQLDSALTATSQVFSKGKVSAEELRQQIGERLPGAFSLFAKSMDKTPQELDKALEKGEVSLLDFQKFADQLFIQYGENAKIIADGPDAAGDRLRTALSRLGESVGTLLKPIGAGFQDIFTQIVNIIDKAVRKFNEFAKIVGQKDLARLRTDLVAQNELIIQYEQKGAKAAQQGSILQEQYARALEKRKRIQAEIIRYELQAKPAGAAAEPPSELPGLLPSEGSVEKQAEKLAKVAQQTFNKTLQQLGVTLGLSEKQFLIKELSDIEAQRLEAIQKGDTEQLKQLDLASRRVTLDVTETALLTEKEKLEKLINEGKAKGLDVSTAVNRLAAIDVAFKENQLDQQRQLNAELLAQQEIAEAYYSRFSYNGEAAQLPTLFNAFEQQIRSLRDEIADTFPEMTQLAGGLSTSFSNAFGNLVFNAKSASETLAQLFKDIAQSFQNMIIQMINDYLKLQIMTFFQNLFAPSPISVTGDYFSGGSTSMFTSPSFGVDTTGLLGPASPFANGGIMTANGPLSLKRYAAGGIASSPQLAVYGEGSTPEAYVPLPDGRTIPVTMKNGAETGNIVVNVDATGSQVQGDQGKSNRLGEALGAAVRAELIRQKRPGGLLA